MRPTGRPLAPGPWQDDLRPDTLASKTKRYPSGRTRTTPCSGNGRELGQVQTRTLLASQITPPRKYSPCPRARTQDPTGPGPGIRTGPGRTPGRTAAAAHHPRHRTGTNLGDFTRKSQTNALTRRPGLGPGRPIFTLGQPASGLETGQYRSTSRRHQAWNSPASQPLPAGITGRLLVTRIRHPALRPANDS